MANKKLQATAQLFLDTKDAQKDAKQFVSDIKQKLSELESAVDKMTVFKDVVSYISQVDKALSALRSKNKDAFNHMFDGLDANLRTQLEGLFGSTGQLTQLDILREKLKTITPKSGISEIRKFAEEINVLFTSFGSAAPFDIEKQFGGKTTAAHIELLTDAISNFALVWNVVNSNISKGFGSGSGNGGWQPPKVASEIQEMIDFLENKNKELERVKENFQKILGEFNNAKNGKGISDTYKVDLTEDSVRGLISQYDALQSQLESTDATSATYYDTLSRLLEISTKLKGAYKGITSDDGLKKLFMSISSGGIAGESSLLGALSTYANRKNPISQKAQKFIDTGMAGEITSNNALIEELRNGGDVNSIIQKRIDLYEKLKVKAKEYQEELMKDYETEEEEDAGYQKLEKLEKEIQGLVGGKKKLEEISDVLGELADDGATVDGVLKSLYKTLGMELPDNFKKRLESLVSEMQSVGDGIGTGTGTGSGGTGTGAGGGAGAGTGGGTGTGGGAGTGGTGTGGTVTAEVDFTTLENTIRTEIAAIASKLEGVLNVEVKNDDIKVSIDSIKTSIDKISSNIEKYVADSKDSDVEIMKKNLLKLLSHVSDFNDRKVNGKYQGQELAAQMMSDGTISLNYGEKGSVGQDRFVAALLANLEKSPLVKIHSHPLHQLINGQKYTSDAFSGSFGDLRSTKFSKSLGNQIYAMITGNILRTLDLGKLTQGQLSTFNSNLKDIEEEYANKYPEHFEIKDGKIHYKRQDTLEGQHKVTELFEEMMYKAFSKIGLSQEYIDQEIFKKYNLTDDAQLTKLAERLVILSQSSQSALRPIERLSEIITQFGGDVQSESAKVAFDAFEKGELSASDVFNQLTNDKFHVNKDTIDSLINIDESNRVSEAETFLTQITSLLGEIKQFVSNIDNQTRKTDGEAFGDAINDVMTLRKGESSIDLSSFNRLTYGVESKFDSDNFSEYKAKEVYSFAKEAASDLLTVFDNASQLDLTQSGAMSVRDIENALKTFSTALKYIIDARDQAKLYENRTGKTAKSYDDEDLRPKIKELFTDVFSQDNINLMLKMLARGKIDYGENISAQVNDLLGGEYSISSGESSIAGDIQSIRDILNSIYNLINVNTDGNRTPNDIASRQLNINDANAEVVNEQKEIADLDKLLVKIREVEQAVRDKTNAFLAEEGTVEQVVQQELLALSKLSVAIDEIRVALNSINNIPVDGIDTTNLNPEVPATEEEVYSEISSLTELQNKLAEVKAAVIAKTKAFDDEGVVVGQVVGKEIAALKQLSAIVDDITPKVNSLIVGLKGLGNQNINISGGDDAQKPKTPEEQFKADKAAQISSLEKYRKSLEGVDYVSAELRDDLQKLAEDLANITTPLGLETFKKDLAEVKKEITYAKSAFDKTNFGYINSAENKLKNSFNSLNLDQKLALQGEFEKAFEELEKYTLGVQDGKKVELDAINTIISALQQKIDAYQQANKEAQKAQKQSGKFGSTAEINATGKFNALQGQINSGPFANSEVVQKAFEQYKSSYDALIAKRKELLAQPFITEEDKADFKELTKECNAYGNALNKLIGNSKKLWANDINGAPYELGGDFDDNAQGRKAALTEFINQLNGVDVATIKFDNNFTKAIYTVNNGDGTFTKMTATFDDARTSIVQLAGETQKATGKIESLWNMFKGKLASIGTYLMASFSFQEVLQQVRRGVQYVRDIDLALTELKKVTNETEQAYQNFLDTASKTASEIGSTVADFTNATADFARLGYDIEQASSLAKAASVYKNVGDGINDVATASESIISTMKAFGIEADDAIGIVDRFNEVGNNFAISSTGIGEAMQRSASALYEAGNTIDESIGLITASNSVIQNPEQVGTALKTLALRLRGAKVELEEAGLETDNMAESTSTLQAKLKALTHGKVDIMLDADTFKNTTQILREMSQAWEEMTDIEKASALELMGGKRQAKL